MQINNESKALVAPTTWAPKAIAASLLGIAVGLGTLPVMALDECGPGPVVECTATPYTNGITYESAVDLSVTKTNPGITTITNNGVNLTVSGGANLLWDSTIGTINAAAGTAGPIVDALSDGGSIDIRAESLSAFNVASATHGVRALSSGAGDISIASSGLIQVGNNNAGGIAAILAQSDGGNIDIVAGDRLVSRQYGIQASTSGAGDISIQTGTGAITTSNTAGVAVAAIEAVTGTGDILIDVNGNIANRGRVLATADGSVQINLKSIMRTASTANVSAGAIVIEGAGPAAVTLGGVDGDAMLFGGIDASGSTGGTTVTNHLRSSWSFVGEGTRFGSGDDLIHNEGLIVTGSGSENTGPGQRDMRLTRLRFGDGDDVFSNAGTLVAGEVPFAFVVTSTGQEDAFLGIGPTGRPLKIGGGAILASETTFEELERFDNSGLIVMGGYVYVGVTGNFSDLPSASTGFGPRFYTDDALGDSLCRIAFNGAALNPPPPNGFPCSAAPPINDTDRDINDVLSMPGTLFNGTGNSTIKLDAMFSGGLAQSDCQQRVGGIEAYFQLPGADCIDLRGGETAGSTQIIVRDTRPGDQGVPNAEGIVIIDVSGGTSAAEHFTLSPESDGYGETNDGRGFVDKGLFVYPLIYDENTQQHKLVGVPGTSAFQLPLMTHAAQALGRQSMGVGLEGRVQGWQAALRAGSQLRGGFWGEFQQDEAERDVVQPLTVLGETFAFNNDFDQDTSTMILGGDFIVPTEGKAAWVMGGSIGYARSQVGFDASGNAAELEGVVLGVHGGYQTDTWYLNAAYGQSFLQVDHYVDTYNLSTAGSGADTKASTEGLRFDGGFRIALADNLHVEPLATLAWVRADVDDLVIASPDNPLAVSNTARFNNAVSLRGALGARIGFEMPLSSLRIHYGLTGRYGSEFDGETAVTIESTGPDANLADTFDGSFLDLAGRIGISDASGNVSGYIDARSTSGDDYSSLGLSAGFRYQW